MSVDPCRFGYVEYDGDRYCFEHGGFAAHLGPRPNLCDRAAYPCGHVSTVAGCGGCDPAAVEWVKDDNGPWRKANR